MRDHWSGENGSSVTRQNRDNDWQRESERPSKEEVDGYFTCPGVLRQRPGNEQSQGVRRVKDSLVVYGSVLGFLPLRSSFVQRVPRTVTPQVTDL